MSAARTEVVGPAGLSSAEAARRLAASGPNELAQPRPLGWRTAVIHQVRDVVILVLIVAAGLTAAVGDFSDMAIILAVIAVNTALGAGQELRSARSLQALATLTAPEATVVRDGADRRLPARDVVTGDLIRLAAGDIVAADATVLQAWSLQLDESMLTGESVPVGRLPGEPVRAGTVVVRGRGSVQVTATGRSTALGRLAGMLDRTPVTATPLQRQLAGLGRWLALAVGIAAAALALLNLATGHTLETSLVLAISLAVAAIPESLPAVVALSLALAARRMAARGVLVRRLAAVEALGSITVIGMDKTGTLTTGTMRVAEVWLARPDAGRALWQAAVLCNDAEPAAARTDPLESALLIAAGERGFDVAAVRSSYPRLAEDPFDAVRASMTTTHGTAEGAAFRLRKGAPDRIFATRPDDEREAAEQVAADYAARGLRPIGVMRDDGTGWQILGILGLADPARPEAPAMIAAFRGAGVRPVMITGDHPVTAAAIARSIGLQRDGEPAPVHARIRPEGKVAIVRELQQRHELVAMTGDGVNDAPALRAADIGVAMGARGTEVAKQAADLVLTEDDLSCLVPAIAEGRRAYDNLRRFLQYALSGGVAEVLIMLLGPLLGFAVPLQAGQILWVNLLTHGLPGVAMGDEAAEPDVLARPPRDPNARLVDRSLQRRVLELAVVITVGCLLVGVLARAAGQPWQPGIFLTLTASQLGVALALHPRHQAPNRMLLAAVLLNVGLLALALWWPPLADALRLEPLSVAFVPVCLAVGLVAPAVTSWRRRDRVAPGTKVPSTGRSADSR